MSAKAPPAAAAAAEKAPRASRRQKADETRARVFTAAARLFAKHGYQATTVDRIAKEAGVAKGTFFVHFKSKDAVVAELLIVQTRAAREAGERARASGDPVGALRATVLALCEQAEISRSLSRGVLAAILESHEAGGAAFGLFDGVVADLVGDVRAAQKEGSLAAHLDPATLASSLLSAYLGALMHFVLTPRQASLSSLVSPMLEAALEAALEGARAERPRAGQASERAREREPRRTPRRPAG